VRAPDLVHDAVERLAFLRRDAEVAHVLADDLAARVAGDALADAVEAQDQPAGVEHADERVRVLDKRVDERELVVPDAPRPLVHDRPD